MKHRTTKRWTRRAAAAALSGGLALAGSMAGAGGAQADTWCPGQGFPGPPGSMPNWDSSVCHDYYWAHKYDLNAPLNLYLEGQPPGPPVPGFCGRDLFTGIPLPC